MKYIFVLVLLFIVSPMAVAQSGIEGHEACVLNSTQLIQQGSAHTVVWSRAFGTPRMYDANWLLKQDLYPGDMAVAVIQTNISREPAIADTNILAFVPDSTIQASIRQLVFFALFSSHVGQRNTATALLMKAAEKTCRSTR